MSDTERSPRAMLANLCRYYLACLGHESGSGVSIPASARGIEYVALNELPFARPDGAVPVADAATRKLIRKARQERGNLALFVGYGLRLRPAPRGPEQEMRIEPVLFYPLEDPPDPGADSIRPDGEAPQFNLDVLKSLIAVDSGNVIDEALQLAEELGLSDTEEDLPPWNEILARLQPARPDWPWRENLDPFALSMGAPLEELRSPGIYNRAILFAGTRSPFTYGLEIELRKLAALDEQSVAGSALGAWLAGGLRDARGADERPILELLPLNAEQRQAVVQGLSAPLTVITGPPGTGKSQTVVALLANMAWQGRSVLLASKNNHAVDVVEARANELAAHPLLFRLGREEHHARVAEQIGAALSESAPGGEGERYEWLVRAHEQTRERFEAVQREIAEVVALRNEVDELERASEPARRLFGAERFAALKTADVAAIRTRIEALGEAIAAARESARMLQPRRAKRVAEAVEDLRDGAAAFGVASSESEDAEAFCRMMSDRLTWAERARAYFDRLEALRRARPIELLARELDRIGAESAGNSIELWRRWVRLRPSRWGPEERKMLSEYVSLLQMIAGGDRYEEAAGKRVFRRYYSLFPHVAGILPCWAVTSLSARGRLPFTAGLFDLVVIDEASQCDIASALPLLFRARRAVIIGDPLQLRHVSTLAPQQDRVLVSAHGLAEGAAAWAYSVNSLFDLARSLCRHEDIVNLREHHRSHRDIISFSNRHFYRGSLRVATDHEALKRPRSTGPAARWVDVRGRVNRPARGGAVNLPEAQSVAAELRELIVKQNYDGSVGVVTPFRAQANRIRALVEEDAELSGRLAALDFVVDTVHGFQGDERDVIVFSPVVSAGIGESAVRFLKRHANLFNVAITRARSELIVLGDRQAAVESGVGYLATFADYARELGAGPQRPPAAQSGPEYPAVAHPESVSEWERLLYRALHAAGMRPIPQFEEAPYTLDFALFDGDRRLDIEVDGENYHRNWDGELCRRDQIRSRRLADLGWDVIRFWVYELREDLAGSVARVEAWLRGDPLF